MQIKNDIPLLSFFYQWRHYERSYGRVTSDLDSFLLAMETVGKGYALLEKEDLYDLCKLILLKPGHKEEDFRQMYDDYLLAVKKQYTKGASIEKQSEKEERGTSEPEDQGANQSEIDQSGKEPELNTPPESNTATPKEETVTSTLSNTETIQVFFEDAEQAAQGIPVETEKQDLSSMVFEKRFIVKGDDYLLPNRILQQSWRSMRLLKEVGPQNILDVPRTIQRVADKGYLDKAVYKAAYKNEAALTLLIDASESMAAFAGLAEKIAYTAKLERHFKHLRTFYFNNIPEYYVFRDERLLDPLDLVDFLNLPKTPVLIFSDAGAARGRMNWDRVQETIDFLKIYNAPRMVWINPMPRERWANNTAEIIAQQQVKMFECNGLEFRNAIKLLRGKLKTKR